MIFKNVRKPDFMRNGRISSVTILGKVIPPRPILFLSWGKTYEKYTGTYLAECYIDIAKISYALGKINDSLAYLKDALSIKDKVPFFSDDIINIHLTLKDIFDKIGDRNNYSIEEQIVNNLRKESAKGGNNVSFIPTTTLIKKKDDVAESLVKVEDLISRGKIRYEEAHNQLKEIVGEKDILKEIEDSKEPNCLEPVLEGASLETYTLSTKYPEIYYYYGKIYSEKNKVKANECFAKYIFLVLSTEVFSYFKNQKIFIDVQ